MVVSVVVALAQDGVYLWFSKIPGSNPTSVPQKVVALFGKTLHPNTAQVYSAFYRQV
jgi:hypothetical protein